jgi:broad specificity phosphatase PhoE
MKLILIRHGETLWNKEGRIQGTSDIELSAVGIEQARLLALSLKDHPIGAIHASPLKRALQTAQIINEHHHKEIQTHPDLMEMDQGDFEGFSFKELMACEKDFLNKWIADPASVRMPNGESLADYQQRRNRAGSCPQLHYCGYYLPDKKHQPLRFPRQQCGHCFQNYYPLPKWRTLY